ncbi:SusD-like starch-binding protein associating with outer membrane [Flavobacterium cutihirudinis]|uniref:SusD-like starch-binding protein associating with outer membrane n=1 Tax=Flavobacterium cutihirudinis TaxID=1265740 RepID=A0A3D9FSW5_9FLAO|nr:RagB/SusD family nutrient uptake outer membrane protein [Flavobacterium cutihirudinis]RED23675.1 SusD-like starch-binding protein associating with outer membrane [Flavobacterium cutihirudinis]
MKKKFLLYAIFFSSLSVFTSCQDDLELTSDSVITSDSFWKTEDDAKAGVNGMYVSFRIQTQQNYYLLGGARSAEITGGVQSPLTLANYYNNNLTPQNIDVEWGGLYTVIHQANLILKYVPQIQFSPSTVNEQKRYIAQAYSMRALCYFIMARSWGGVPIVTDPTENSNQSQYIIPRNTIEETFAFIKSDVDAAIANFPDAANNKTQLSAASAYALKADVNLWTAKQLNGGTTDLNTALTAINAIPGTPTLMPSFKDVFAFDKKANAEVLFAVRYSLGDLPSSLADNWNQFMFVGPSDFAPLTAAQAVAVFGTLGTGSGNAGISRVQPDITRFNFGADDTRKAATYQTLYNGTTPVVTGLVKYNGTVDGTIRRFVSDIIIYRWADILLMKAEIKNALGQDPSTEMNLVMQRADATASFTNSTKTANDDVILKERLKELAFEGKSWWDIVRFNRTDLVPSMAGKQVLFPISQNTINFNPKIEQNPL